MDGHRPSGDHLLWFCLIERRRLSSTTSCAMNSGLGNWSASGADRLQSQLCQVIAPLCPATRVRWLAGLTTGIRSVCGHSGLVQPASVLTFTSTTSASAVSMSNACLTVTGSMHQYTHHQLGGAAGFESISETNPLNAGEIDFVGTTVSMKGSAGDFGPPGLYHSNIFDSGIFSVHMPASQV
ncbi:unnamed protein product [Protopolystoma xenopodis]|uniref:Uncharacterized protein n=1 Tax=Protopolystoma xenopodis TaxID=117903 RepID=A0A448XB46_9PLAT|nr:unnamed protein product [Protopolystoma xenopodis]